MIMIMRESQSRFLPRSTQRVPAKILAKIPATNNGKVAKNILPKTLAKSRARNFVKIPTKILVHLVSVEIPDKIHAKVPQIFFLPLHPETLTQKNLKN